MEQRYFEFGEYDERIFVKDLKSLSFSTPSIIDNAISNILKQRFLFIAFVIKR